MTSEIDKLKHFYIKDDKEVTFLCKYVKNKHIEACSNYVFNNYFCHGSFM